MEYGSPNPDKARVNEIPSPNLEAELMKEFEGREYITKEDFDHLLERANLDKTFHSRGTYMPFPKEGRPDAQVYVYAKRDFISKDLPSAKEKLRLCRELTRLGALFPQTVWGIFQRKSGQFQVFAITRKLELDRTPWNEHDTLRNSTLLHDRVDPEYAYFIDDGEANRNPMGHLPGSDVLYPVDIEVIAGNFDEREALEREQLFTHGYVGVGPIRNI